MTPTEAMATKPKSTKCNTCGEQCGSTVALINHCIDNHYDEN